MKKIIYLIIICPFLFNCGSSNDDGCAALFGYCCEDCRFVNLLDSCEDTSSTRIEISCDEYDRLVEIRQSSTTACIEITVNPSDGGQAVSGYGRDWFFNCN